MPFSIVNVECEGDMAVPVAGGCRSRAGCIRTRRDDSVISNTRYLKQVSPLFKAKILLKFFYMVGICKLEVMGTITW